MDSASVLSTDAFPLTSVLPLNPSPAEGRAPLRKPGLKTDLSRLGVDELNYVPDTTRSVPTRNPNPEIPAKYSLSPYRICEAGCECCSLVMNPGESEFPSTARGGSKIYIKEKIATQLRKELLASKWKPQLIALSGSMDPYCPLEDALRLTRGTLEILNEFRNPVSIVTRSALVARDIDLLKEMTARQQVVVQFAISSQGEGLSQLIQAIREIARGGIPVGVVIDPVLDSETDQEIPAILQATAQAGAIFTLLKSTKKANRSFADRVKKAFQTETGEYGLSTEHPALSATEFRRSEDPRQMWLFG